MFQGFDEPKQNYSKMPNVLIENLHLLTSESEIKTILYVLRHTWGFQEFDEYQAKHITTDEFEKGRKRSDGTRLDDGTGLSKPSIYDGLSRAVEHGFLVCFIDNVDRGRITHYYQLRRERDQPSRVYAIDPDQIKAGNNNTSWHWLKDADKKTIYSKFGGRCAYCEGKSKSWHYDHIFPKSKGGPDLIENIALSCPTCNMAKRDRSPDQWGKQVILYENDVKTFYRGWEQFVPDDVKILYITMSKVFTPPSKDSLPRSEKETIQKETKGNIIPGPLAQKLLSICLINENTLTERQSNNLKETLRILVNLNITPEQLCRFEDFWQMNWRGKGGPPSLLQIPETWGEFEQWLLNPTDNQSNGKQKRAVGYKIDDEIGGYYA